LQSKRKLTKVSKSSYSLSPGPSPVSLRRDGPPDERTSLRHERSLSDTPAVPVSLTAESCSVAGLPGGPGFRRGSGSSQGEAAVEAVPGQARRRRSRQRPASSGPGAPALELPPRGGASAPPPRPPDYYGAGPAAGGHRLGRTQSREEEETQVSAV
jgi:hypothetical protein